MYVAPWCNWLTRGPFKAESTGSIPVGATKLNRNRNKMLKLLAILHQQSVDESCGNYAAIPIIGVAARLATSISVEDTPTPFCGFPPRRERPRPSSHQAETSGGKWVRAAYRSVYLDRRGICSDQGSHGHFVL
jgi:hypothetical protein